MDITSHLFPVIMPACRPTLFSVLAAYGILGLVINVYLLRYRQPGDANSEVLRRAGECPKGVRLLQWRRRWTRGIPLVFILILFLNAWLCHR